MAKNWNDWHIDLSTNSTLFGIRTDYNGIKFRSKKEAEIAKFLEQHCIKFEYEKKVVDNHNWTCDFYLSKWDLWLEYDGIGDKDRKQMTNYAYNEDHPKIKYYEDNDMNYVILPKYWQPRLESLVQELLSNS